MHFLPNFILFAVTLAGGVIPLLFKGFTERQMQLLLAFSGAFLLSITFLHLLPETFEDHGEKVGFYLLAGFFLQLLVQRITHGIEHGHVHVHTDAHNHHVPIMSIVAGLSLHAVMEGLPLGFNYRHDATTPSLYLAVAAHKLPEALLLCSLVMNTKGKQQALLVVTIFSMLTPLAGMAGAYFSHNYNFMARMVTAIVPIVAGAFIHISTTIFFESGTKQHGLTWQKVIAITIGATIGLVTLCFE
jgi:zinc transporter ZupT